MCIVYLMLHTNVLWMAYLKKIVNYYLIFMQNIGVIVGLTQIVLCQISTAVGKTTLDFSNFT